MNTTKNIKVDKCIKEDSAGKVLNEHLLLCDFNN